MLPLPEGMCKHAEESPAAAWKKRQTEVPLQPEVLWPNMCVRRDSSQRVCRVV